MNEEYLKDDGYFRVIKIISNLEIIINGGTMDGLNEDDDINIIVPGDIITDPYDDNKKLGSLDYIKDTLTIKTVTPYFSICHKVRTEVVEKGIASKNLHVIATSLANSPLMNFSDTTRNIEVPLDIIEDEITEGYPEPTELNIIIGDYAKKRY